jgi:sucrose-6-phosphate hydrolase SacC (GH32 family)
VLKRHSCREGWQNASGTTDSVFGWESTASVTRELKADLSSQILTFYPLAELASLRTEQLVDVAELLLEAGRFKPLIGTAANQRCIVSLYYFTV